MAEVTIVSTQPLVRSPEGSVVHLYARINIATSGDTFSPRLSRILHYSVPVGLGVTGFTEGTDSATYPNLALTTSSPALANVPIHVVGYE